LVNSALSAASSGRSGKRLDRARASAPGNFRLPSWPPPSGRLRRGVGRERGGVDDPVARKLDSELMPTTGGVWGPVSLNTTVSWSPTYCSPGPWPGPC
jgi:hypothetical protein